MNHATRRVLGIDPSCAEAAAALIQADQAFPHCGRLLQIWRVCPSGKTLADKLIDLLNELQAVIAEARPNVVVVEMPADKKRGRGRQQFGNRSIVTLPSYGAAVGICVAATVPWSESEEASKVLFPSSSEWPGRDVPPATKIGPDGRRVRDDYKEARVASAAQLWKMRPEAFGPRSVAGNAADACFLARFGLWRTER